MVSKNQPISEEEVIKSILSRAHYLAIQMIYQANHRDLALPGEPKVGGHSATCASSIHIQGAINLIAKSGFDYVASKPHSSPGDHAFNYLLRLFFHEDGSQFSDSEAHASMFNLRKFPKENEAVFQSYHSHYDPDDHNFLPTGSVGIPAVQAGYLGLAYKYAREHGYIVPNSHFWAVIGDAEFKEGSLSEAAPDFAARELGNLTWIVDYNRQSLDGARYGNIETFDGNDDTRIENMMSANGWDVIQLRHGQFRQNLFEQKHGESFRLWLEKGVSDEELQAILQIRDVTKVMEYLKSENSELSGFLDHITPDDLYTGLHDFGGHDTVLVAEALQESKKDSRTPTIIIVHTVKGWGLDMAANPGNHSMITKSNEIELLKKREGLASSDVFTLFASNSPEGLYLEKRRTSLIKEISAQKDLKRVNQKRFLAETSSAGSTQTSLDINLRLANHPHTQWMFGQITSKLTRIANTSEDKSELTKGQKPLTKEELGWKLPAELTVTMAPDVGTSTNLNPSMDGKVYSSQMVTNSEEKLGIENRKTPNLIPKNETKNRFLRFDIEEGNVMSCMGSFGKMRDLLGIPILPIMTVYDFFVKRALDQFFYNLYWKSSFICVGTPSGVTLSYEGAQHGWKSDFQIPNQITWEPMFCQELDWIFSDAVNRHMTNNNSGRTGVHLRNVTKGIDQKDLLKYLKKQSRFKNVAGNRPSLSHSDFPMDGGTDESTIGIQADELILSTIREDVLRGAYYLINYDSYQGYEPGDNVVNIFALGCMGSEAIKASNQLLNQGIYANVIIVTSPELLLGNLGHAENYSHLKEGLKITSNLYLSVKSETSLSNAEASTLSGCRVPVVSVHDGEPGFLDNIGSIVGVRQKCLAVRRHSRCGSSSEIYKFHGIDSSSIVNACQTALEETALEKVILSKKSIAHLANTTQQLQPSL